MKNILIIISFIGFNAFSQTFEVVNKGYYYGVVGETTLPNRTTDLKALTDVQEYLDKNNLEYGEVIRPRLEVTRKKTAPVPPQIIRDTIYINNVDISIGNQWMGEPVKEMKVTGTPIYDNGGSWVGENAGGPEAVFDGNTSTFRRASHQQGAWVGQDFGINRIINKVRVYPHNFQGGGINLDGCIIYYSTDHENWTALHTISGAVEDEWYEYSFPGIAARYWAVEADLPASHGGHIAELEFYNL